MLTLPFDVTREMFTKGMHSMFPQLQVSLEFLLDAVKVITVGA